MRLTVFQRYFSYIVLVHGYGSSRKNSSVRSLVPVTIDLLPDFYLDVNALIF